MALNFQCESSRYILNTVRSQINSANTLDTSECQFRVGMIPDKGLIELEHFQCPNVFYYQNLRDGCQLVFTINGAIYAIDIAHNCAPDLTSLLAYLNGRFVAFGVPLFTIAENAYRPGTLLITNGYALDATIWCNPANNPYLLSRAFKILGLNPRDITVPAHGSFNTGFCALAPNNLYIKVNERIGGNATNCGPNFTFTVPIEVNHSNYITWNKYTGYVNQGTDYHTNPTIADLFVTITDEDGFYYNMTNVCYSISMRVFIEKPN